MINRPIHWKINGKDANTVLEGAEVKIPIYSANYDDIFIDRDIINALVSSRNEFYKVFSNDDEALTNSLMNEIHLSYIPKNGNYYIGFDYQEMFQNILSKLAVEDCIVKDLKIKDSIESVEDFYDCFCEIERAIYMDKQLRENYPAELPDTIMTDEVLNKLLNRLGTVLRGLQEAQNQIELSTFLQLEEEKEFSEGKRDIAIKEHDHISWKNLMLYTSAKALHIFDKTKDIKYYKYAKNYYTNISKSRSASYPKNMIIDGKNYHCDYSNFNSEFLSIRKNNFPEILVRLGIEDKDIITIRPNLKKGDKLRGTIEHGKVTDKKIDYTKINPALGRKITYYQGLVSRTNGILSSFGKDKDYIGYILDNNYVVYDKFYELDGDNAKPARGAALYIVSLDVLNKCGFDRKKVKRYIDKHHNNKAFRYIHNENDSYQGRIDEALNLRDRSRIKYKGLRLRLEDK